VRLAAIEAREGGCGTISAAISLINAENKYAAYNARNMK
jgi:hypothetical protein